MSSKYTILAVAILAMAAFVGVSIVGDDTDAETTGYSVSYIVDGRTFTVPQETGVGVTAGTVSLATLTALGASAPEDMSFTAWNTAEDGSGTAYSAGSTLIIDPATKTATLYAQFKWTEYTAVFEAIDGTIIKTLTGTAQAGHIVSMSAEAPSAPAIEGKIFSGWLATGADKALKASELGDLRADVTYTATYVIDYAVTFVDGDKTYITKVSDLTIPDVGTRTGYTFLGWFVGTEQVADPSAYEFVEDTTFSAKWEPVNVYVTFVAGSFATTVAVLYGQTVVEPALPDGYERWDFDFTTPVTEDITVNAIAKAAPAPSGLDDPIYMTMVIIVGLLAMVAIAALVWAMKNGKVVIGKGPNAKKKADQDAPKGPEGGQQ